MVILLYKFTYGIILIGQTLTLKEQTLLNANVIARLCTGAPSTTMSKSAAHHDGW
jgi:hypothetical protein